MKKFLSFSLAMVFLFTATFLPAYASAGSRYQWDGERTTIFQLEEKLGIDLFDNDGDYLVPYYKDAAELWKKGLLKGDEYSLSLNSFLDRAEGTTMIVRILGKEEEAKSLNLPCKFLDVPEWAKPYVSYAVEKALELGLIDEVQK